MIGQHLGPYRVEALIGEGGMGTVYRASDPLLGRDVAIKLLRGDLAGDQALVERFQQEARLLAGLAHPNIAVLYGLFRHEQRLFMAMELVEGETLAAALARRARLPWPEACRIGIELLRGLECAHRAGVVHRDLKPANLLLTASGALKITDFGIARMVGSARQTRTGAVVGTLAYMAPEQVSGEPGDERSDLYAAGMVLYEMLTGEVAFDGSSDYALMRAVVEGTPRSPRMTIPDVPEALERSVMTALSKAPVERFQSAAEFARALETMLASAPPAAVLETRLAAGYVPALAPTRLAQSPATRLAPPAVAGTVTKRGWSWRHGAAAAAVIVMLGVTAAMFFRSSHDGTAIPAPATPPATQLVAATTDAAAPGLAPPVASNKPAAIVPPSDVIAPPPARPSPTPKPQLPLVQLPVETPVESPVPPTDPPPPAATAPAISARPAAPIADATFDRVKMLVTTNGRPRETDVRLRLSGSEIVLLAEKGDTIVKTVPYARVETAIYSQSRHPRWKEGSAAAIAVGVFAAPVFFMKGTKHWLTLEGSSDAIVLQLDKRNYQAILPLLEARSGKRVERRTAEERN